MWTGATNACNGCKQGATNAMAMTTGATDADGNKPKNGVARFVPWGAACG